MVADAKYTSKSALVAILATSVYGVDAACRCLPGDPCWPTDTAWASLNSTVSGKLIKNVPVAAPCYPGPHHDAAACAVIETNWSDSVFQSQYPTGYDFPHEWTCNLPGRNSSTCSLGDYPVYSINATTPAAISAGLKFAAQYNLRVTVKQSGHDFLGRSAGTGSLEIWTRYLRDDPLQSPLVFAKAYTPAESCAAVQEGGAAYWGGSAVRIGGAFTWDDVYPVAHENGVVVVGGTCNSVGIIGGYLQGGGHGAAMHEYGLGTDQVLEYNVILANGSTVLASPCSHPDLFQALRGGGPGTYGVVTSATVRTYPDTPMTGIVLLITPQEGNDDLDTYLDAVTTWYQQTPHLLDGGVQGYAAWVAWDGQSSLAPPSRMLEMITGVFNQTIEQVQSTMEPVMAQLLPFNSRGLNVSIQYLSFPDYFSYTAVLQHNSMEVGGGIIMSSRFYEAKHLANATSVRQMVMTTAGLPGQNTSVIVDITGGGAVKNDWPLTGVNPAYRRALLTNIVGRNWDSRTPYADIAEAREDVTRNKGRAQEDLAPDTGSYMNEGNYLDPNYLTNFYGDARPTLEAAKKKYDPENLFYCPTCIGSQNWLQEPDGRLCTV
ncbi:FAD-binding domain-containing protein [Trichoderma citrinoviride]|uniref:FAD-binding domain-containing protein n=1 Tax=Trichoderma citrinoviride TaxID=58853 RepID=A0A2T4B6K0_9HYPO|nr:FAD-binding domain-containing protein [Trichoderma citrinoviride]PTB64966.1 FAD-binding domain-containing protein [Trichoderma citrinoviride]